MKIEENTPLAPYTTFQIGGPARYFVEAKREEDIIEALGFAEEKKLPVFVLGGGSNILISDEGFAGLVIKNSLIGIKDEGDGVILVGAGEQWDEFVEYAVGHDLGGVECLSGIPGAVGAAPVQNIGAYGQEVSAVIEEARAIHIHSKENKIFGKDECEFSYRNSSFKEKFRNQYIITAVKFRLHPHAAPQVSYKDYRRSVQEELQGIEEPTLLDVRSAVLRIRESKGMLAGIYNSAGSFFKAVVVSKDELEYVREVAEREFGDTIPSLEPWYRESKEGKYKISGGFFTELLYGKGFKKGNVGISPKHSLALVNLGSGTAMELVTLAREIQEKVKEKFGVLLEPEVELVGFPKYPLSEKE